MTVILRKGCKLFYDNFMRLILWELVLLPIAVN